MNSNEEFNKIEKDGKAFYWCNKHKYPTSETPGMYVAHKPTEHDAWQACKTTFNDPRGKQDKVPTPASMPTTTTLKPSVQPNASKLPLAESLQEALTTTAGLTEDHLGELLQCLGKLNGPGHRIELIMGMCLLPFIFSVRAAISFLLSFQVIVSRCNIVQCTRFLITTSTQVIWQSLKWIGFLFWTFMNSYTGRFWLSFLCWMFIVPIVLFMFFWSIYNFVPDHCK